MQSMTRPYSGVVAVPRSRAGAGRSMHPLMAWWAVLFTLSMLARYQPAEWAAHVNVDASRHAVPVERLLTRDQHIPALIAEAIAQVAGNVPG